jgi:hypothetical protein
LASKDTGRTPEPNLNASHIKAKEGRVFSNSTQKRINIMAWYFEFMAV